MRLRRFIFAVPILERRDFVRNRSGVARIRIER